MPGFHLPWSDPAVVEALRRYREEDPKVTSQEKLRQVISKLMMIDVKRKTLANHLKKLEKAAASAGSGPREEESTQTDEEVSIPHTYFN